MATVKFGVPDKEQSILLRKMDIDPDQYAVVIAGEHFLCILHHKTRNDATVYLQENAEGSLLNEEQQLLLRSMGIEPSGYKITLAGKRLLRFAHERSGYGISIYPNRRSTYDNQ